MTVDSFSHSSREALDDLDPLSRALVDLSIKQGMSDPEIAEVLSTDADTVFENRVALLRALAGRVAPESVDADVPQLEAVVAERLYGEPGAEVPGDAVETEETVVDEPVQPERKRRSPRAVLLPLLVLGALIAAIVIVASNSNDEESDTPAPQAQDSPAESISLTPLGGGDARATATVDGNELRLRLSNLPAGTYEVWLYDSVIDARRIGRVAGDGTVTAELPANAGEFTYVDVSREPNDGNPNHSGQSVLRVPTSELR